jgi:hypothetical protein
VSLATKVKVLRIVGINDPISGQPGKQIELLEVKQRSSQQQSGISEESRVIKGIISQFQSLGMFPQIREVNTPKLTLFLSEKEYDDLGIRFEVNDIYDIVFNDGYIGLKKSIEGV